MLGLVLRRARVQRRLLTAVVVLVAIASTLSASAACCSAPPRSRAFPRWRSSGPRRPTSSVTASSSSSTAATRGVRGRGRAAWSRTCWPDAPPHLEPPPRRASRAPDGERQAYLMMTDGLPRAPTWCSGRWPRRPARRAPRRWSPRRPRACSTSASATRSRSAGDRARRGGRSRSRVVVVGTFRPRAGVEWERDPLAGRGSPPPTATAQEAAPTYGPFVVDKAAFLATGSSVSAAAGDRPARPRAGRRDAPGAPRPTPSTTRPDCCSAQVGDRRADHPAGLRPARAPSTAIHAQQASTPRDRAGRAVLLGTALALAAALLAGRLVASVRDDERELLRAMGLVRRQQLAAAGDRGGAARARGRGARACPASGAAALAPHPPAGPRGRRARRRTRRSPSGLVRAVLGAPSRSRCRASARRRARPETAAAGPTSRRGAVGRRLGSRRCRRRGARLVAVRDQRPRGSGDVTLTLAPVLCVAALTVLGVRLVPVVLGRAAAAGAAFALPRSGRWRPSRPRVVRTPAPRWCWWPRRWRRPSSGWRCAPRGSARRSTRRRCASAPTSC